MATHSSTLAWKIPRMEEPGGLQSMGSLSRTQLSDFTLTFHFHALEKEMATHSSVLAWRIPGTGEPGGLPSMGSRRVGHDWSDLAAAAAVEPPEGVQSCWHPDFSTAKLILKYWPPGVKEDKFLLIYAPKFVVICFSSHRKLILKTHCFCLLLFVTHSCPTLSQPHGL